MNENVYIRQLCEEIERLHKLVDASRIFAFSDPHGDEVYVVERNGHDRWELHVSSCSGGGLLEVYTGTDARDRAIAEARKRAEV